jgi:hypothetical protein
VPATRIIRSPAQNFALAVGVALTVVGIAGFFCSSSFGKPGDPGDLLGVLRVNGWHNLLHITTGLLGLAVARFYGPARAYAIGLGTLYGALAIWGFVIGTGDSILGIVPVNAEDNVLHLVIALAGVGAGFGTPATPRPSGASTAPAGSFRELRS